MKHLLTIFLSLVVTFSWAQKKELKSSFTTWSIDSY